MWLLGACVVAPGVCAWLLPGGHAWLLPGGCAWLLPGVVHGCSRGGMCGCSQGGMCGCSGGACVVAPRGACVVAPGGHVWLLLGGHAWFFRSDTVNERAVHILLECILVKIRIKLGHLQNLELICRGITRIHRSLSRPRPSHKADSHSH